MNRNPINKHRSVPRARENWSSRIAGMILLLAFVLCGKPLAAQTQTAQTPAKQDAAAQARFVPSRITQAVDETRLSLLRGNTHPLARPEFARGAAPPSLPMDRMMLVLKRSADQQAALQKLLDEQQDKSSLNYHKWLTPEQFGQQFGPSDQDIQTVTSWLQSHGFQVAQVAKGRTVIEFSGVAAQVQEAFHTSINKYVVSGEEHWANASDPQIPAALAPVVQGPVSLHNFPRKPVHHVAGAFSRSKETGQVTPLFTDTGNTPPQFFAIGPTDFATIYNVKPLWNASTPIDGTGQTIAIVAQSNIVIQDVRDFRNLFGLPAHDPVITLNGPDPGIVSSDEGESILDVEWAGAVAKGATINLVVSESTLSASGVDLSAVYIVDNNLAPVLSESYGACEASLGTGGNQFFNAIWQQAAAQGITVLVASGDVGSAGCDALPNETAASSGLAVSGIASTPFNVSVGGTDFDDIGNQSQYWNTTNNPGTRDSAKSYIPELTWNDSCAASGVNGCTSASSSAVNLTAAGGGPSSVYSTKPSWQTGTGVPADGKRDQPDVSLFASFESNSDSFYVVCQADQVAPNPTCNTTGTFHFLGVGGTSASAQAFAGIMALVNQKTGSRQGNANFVFYNLAASNPSNCNSSSGTGTGPGCIFYDVTKGNISVACAGGSLNCSKTTSGGFGVMVSGSTPAWTTTTAYDMATGLGTVNVANLANKWATAVFTPTSTALTLNGGSGPINIAHGTTVTVNVTVAPSPGTPTPQETVSVVSDAASGAGIDVFPLSGTTASGTTDLLPGGTYNVHAHYPGDGSFGASDSNAISVTVTKESSRTFAALVTFDLNGNVTNGNASTAAYGSPYIFRVDVTNSSGNDCYTGAIQYGCPTGTVTLTDNSQPLDGGTFTLNSLGHLEDQPIQLPPGSHSIVASYAGDNSFNASGPVTDTVSITKAATTSAVTSSSSTITSGGSVTLTATVSTLSSGVAPTGTVQFLNGTTPISGTVTYSPTNGSANAVAKLTATLTTTLSASLIQHNDVYYASNRQKGSGWLFASSGLMLGFLILPGIPAKLRRRKGFFIVLFLTLAVLSVGVVGCGGGGSGGGGGGGGGGGTSRSISAQYTGDANYTGSTAPAIIVTVQ